MRAIPVALCLVFTAFALVGCAPPGAATGEVGSAATAATLTTGCQTFHIWITPASGAPPASDDPWAENHLSPGYVISYPAFGGINVVGIDSTMTTIEWNRIYADDQTEFYSRLPETIPWSCPNNLEVGQVGGNEVNTGSNGNEGHYTFCPDPGELQNLETTCACVPEDPVQLCGDAGLNCGTVVDNCKNVITCGTCSSFYTCNEGLCQPKVKPKPIVPPCKGVCI